MQEDSEDYAMTEIIAKMIQFYRMSMSPDSGRWLQLRAWSHFMHGLDHIIWYAETRNQYRSINKLLTITRRVNLLKETNVTRSSKVRN